MMVNMGKLRVALPLGLLLVAGCESTPPLTNPQALTVVAGTDLPPPSASDTAVLDPDYAVGPLDRLRIDVFGNQDLSGRIVQVDNGGNIAFAGTEITAAGRTPAQIGEQIEAALRENYFRDPRVTVNLEQAAARSVTVFGEVRTPGVYPVTGRMTLLRAIASAQGLTEVASRDEVIVTRTVNGQNYAAIYSLQAIRAGTYADPRIYPNDVVSVGDSPARRRFRDLIQVAPLLTTPLVLLLQ